MTTGNDCSQRFLFDALDVRGEAVRLNAALGEMLANQPYSESIRQLLGEFAAAVVLISNNLKYTGRITLQARSDSALTLAMVECTSERQIRGIARGNLAAEAQDPMTLLAGGQLALTIEREKGQQYQGIIAIEGFPLATALENYFAQSEQLGARFWLASNGTKSAGLMLQQLPAQLTSGSEREEQWSTLCILAETIQAQELLSLTSEDLLYKLYPEERIKVYPPAPILFKCRCSRKRSADTIALLPVSEQAEILEEAGEITLTCELCGATYRFDEASLASAIGPENRTLH